MAKEIDIFQIDAFSDKPFAGNPAGVVISDKLNEKEKQLIAKEMNLSETAFLSKSEIADYKLQWFTPTKEVELCGHATIASLHLLYQKKILRENKIISFETRSGVLDCFTRDAKYFMRIPIPELYEYQGCREEIISLLGMNRVDASDLPFILLNNGYLFIKVNSLNALKMISPDFDKLKLLSESRKKFFDFAVFTDETIDEDSSAHLRFFAPYYGINEDPVTGSACGPLLLVMIKLGLIDQYKSMTVIKFEQGDLLNRSGRVYVQFDLSDKLFISGKAVTVLEGKIKY
jgi:PhzF family phenazine biosynthesis protein